MDCSSCIKRARRAFKSASTREARETERKGKRGRVGFSQVAEHLGGDLPGQLVGPRQRGILVGVHRLDERRLVVTPDLGGWDVPGGELTGELMGHPVDVHGRISWVRDALTGALRR
jgi:hypothetical protein